MTKKRTNVVIDTAKLSHAKKISGLNTTRDVVDYALSRLIRTTKALREVLELKGKVRFDKDYDYKESR